MIKILFKFMKGQILPLAIILAFLLIVCYITRKKDIIVVEQSTSNKKSSSSCSSVFKLNKNTTVPQILSQWRAPSNDTLSDAQLLHKIRQNCDNFLDNRNYYLHLTKTSEEKQMHIAYSIIINKKASQVERLFKLIYRPWNYYCFHVDKKSDDNFFRAIEELAYCLRDRYHNIIVTANRVEVKWAEMSVLQADLNCMKELYDRYKDWKYLINLTGQEFPLKTNAELAKILMAYRGANNIEGLFKQRNEERVPTDKLKFPIVWYKGSAHITANRNFIQFIFETSKAKMLLEALKNRLFPDQQFFATLNHNSQLRIPGSFLGNPDLILKEGSRLNFLSRYESWIGQNCASNKVVRGLCIFGLGDLPELIRAPHLFANKFYDDFQPATLMCLEKWHQEKIERETSTGIVAINDTFYNSLPFVKYQYIPPLD